MPAEKCRASAESQETADLIDEGRRDLIDFAPGLLRKKMVELVFLPWLCRYTQRVREAARRGERQAILSIPDLPDETKAIIKGWTEP